MIARMWHSKDLKVLLFLSFYLFTSNIHGALTKNRTELEKTVDIDDDELVDFDRILSVNEREHVIDELFEGDIVLPKFRNAHGRRWHKSTDGYVRVPYTIENDYTAAHRQLINSAMNVLAQHTCIRFVPRASTHRSYVSIENNAGCSSSVGRLFSKQSLSLSIPSCLRKGVIIHELMHAIGFQHEQSRSDRNEYIRINQENIRGSLVNFKRYGSTQNLVIYDYGSIMHYGKHAFAKYSFLKTIEVIPRQRPEPQMGQREQMSPYDIEEIKYYYECGSNTYNRCGRDFENVMTGSFNSPSYPQPYPSEAHCTWTIKANPGRYVSVLFSNVNIQESTLCVDDAIILHDGINAGSPLLTKICGTHAIVPITSTQRYFFVIFRSDMTRSNNNGFQATFNEATTRGNAPPPLNRREIRVPTIRQFVNELQCDFDVGMCGMTQDNIDDRNWERRGDQTPTFKTGPPSDMSESGSGQFLYLEATGAKLGDIGVIRTPWFKRTGSLCITFGYHMYGNSMGGLQLYAYEKLQSTNIGNNKFLWGKLRDQGFKWHTQTVTYNPDQEVEHMQFYWEGIINGDTSDIALDNINIVVGSCNVDPIKPELVYKSHFCNFETGLCAFKQSTSDVFDWLRVSGPTTTQNTGPSTDHTTKQGFYMYAQGARGQNNVAKLISPALTVEPHCLNLWYHMHGKNIGKLTVYRQHKGFRTKMAEIIGSQGDEWKKLRVTIAKSTPTLIVNNYVTTRGNRVKRNTGRRSTNYVKIVIEATIGNGSLSDIAIDDVYITGSRCDPATENQTPQLPNKFACDFESGITLCGLQQMDSDKFDWTRHQGRTRSRGTGPSADNTLKTAVGHYIYTEASGRILYDVAKIKTPKLRSGQFCVSFDYHMFGNSVGQLKVFSIENPGNRATSLWTKTGNQRNRWIKASINFNSNTGHSSVEFMFQAVLGTSYSGDIAIDNVNITQGSCVLKPNTTSPTSINPSPTPIYRMTSPGLVPIQKNPTNAPITTSTQTTETTATTTIRSPPVTTNGMQLWAGMPLCTFETVSSTPVEKSRDPVPGNSRNDLGPYVYPSTYTNDILCGWRQFRSYDRFDWTLLKGATPSQNTGPSGDKTTGNGHYLYLETSTQEPYDSAYLQTYFMPSTDYCIDMNYHMFGSSIGSLVIRTVQFDKAGSRHRPLLKTYDRSLGNRWQHAKIDFTPSAESQRVAFRFEGIVGNGRRGDIAVDDVAILPGRCDACQNPQYHHTDSSGQKHFATGCVHKNLFWVRCCSSSRPKFVYRRVQNCRPNIFKAARLDWYCRNF